MWGMIAGVVMIGLLSAAAVAGWNGFTGGYETKGAIAQKAVDQQVVNLAEARATRAEASALQAAKAAKSQSEALTSESQRTAAAQAESKVISNAYAAVVKSSEARIAALHAAAAAQPVTGLSCEAMLSATDKILRDSAKIIRNSIAR